MKIADAMPARPGLARSVGPGQTQARGAGPKPSKTGPAGASGSASASKETQDVAHTVTRGFLAKQLSLGAVKAMSWVYNFLILHYLSATSAGLFNVANSFIVLVSQMMGLGLPSAAIRYAPMYKARGESERLKQLVWTLTLMTLGISAFVFAAFSVGGPAIAKLYGTPELEPVMPWIAILSVLFLLFNFWTNLLDALKQFGRGAALQAVQQGLRVGLTLVAFFAIGRTVDLAFGTYLFSMLASTLYLAWYLHGWLASLGGRLAFSIREAKESLRFGIPAYLSAVVDTLTTYMDVLLVGFFLDLKAVAAYSAVVIYIRNIGPFVLSPLGSVQQPVLVEHVANNSAMFGPMVREMSRWAAYLGVPFLGLFLVLMTAVLKRTSDEYLGSAGLVWLFAPGVVMMMLSAGSRAALFARGHIRALMAVSLAVLGLNLAFNILLIPTFGLTGSAVATTIAIVAGEGLAMLLARWKCQAQMHPDIGRALAAGALMVLVGFAPLPLTGSLSAWAMGGWLELGASILALGAVYLIGLVFVGGIRGGDWRMAGALVERAKMEMRG